MFVLTAERKIVRDIKKLYYFALVFIKERSISVEKNYKLPDGRTISAMNISFAQNISFNLDFLGKESFGLYEITYNSIIDEFPLDIRKDLYAAA